MSVLSTIISGKIIIIGLTSRPDNASVATIAPIATTITTGIRIFMIGCGASRRASGTGSAMSLPCGSGGAGSAA